MSDYSKLTKKEASALISDYIRKAEAAVSEAESIADATGVGFSLDLGGYGMGGYYHPAPIKPDDADEYWEASDEDYGWQASSQSC
jgi:hypothetical protein